MRTLGHWVLASVAAVFTCTLATEGGVASERLQALRLAPLQIMCIRAPCPWGEMAINPVDASDSPHPLYRGPLPRLQAGPAVSAAIRRTWHQRGCLIVEGSIERRNASGRTSLRVSRILRRC